MMKIVHVKEEVLRTVTLKLDDLETSVVKKALSSLVHNYDEEFMEKDRIPCLDRVAIRDRAASLLKTLRKIK